MELEHRAHWAIRQWNMDLKQARKNRQIQLAELEEWREKAYHSAKICKDRIKRWHNKRIKPKEFKPKDKVLLFNSRVKLFGKSKLRSKWKGLYTIVNASSHGSVTLRDDEGKLFKVNGQRLKFFHMPYNSSEEFDIINLVEFDTFQAPQSKNKTQNHLHGGHLVPPNL